MKRQWQRPRLLVIQRGTPEEAVLTVCKDGEMGGWGTAAAANWFYCLTYPCTNCSTTSPS